MFKATYHLRRTSAGDKNGTIETKVGPDFCEMARRVKSDKVTVECEDRDRLERIYSDLKNIYHDNHRLFEGP